MKMKKQVFSNFPLGKKAIILLGLLVILSSFVSATTIQGFQYDDVNGSDTSTSFNDKNVVYGGETYIYSGTYPDGNEFNGFMNWNNTLKSIPSNAQINWVKLELTMMSGGGVGGTVEMFIYPINKSWDEATLTYNTLPSGCLPDVCYNSTFVIGHDPLVAHSTYERFNITLNTTWYQNLVNQGSSWKWSQGFIIIHTALGNSHLFGAYTSEYSTTTSYRPTLWVSYYEEAEKTPPTISSLNCTSCDVPYGDNEPPYETYDTTPTFTFDTNQSTWCRIANANLSYNAMNTSRSCTSGDGGAIGHTCTLKDFDELKLTPTDYVYLNCINEWNNETIAGLNMSITKIQYNASQAIDKGIVISIPSATVYSDQQVYVRTVSNNQALATFDKVALYGSQRWAFNYVDLSVNESSVMPFYNLSPVFYFLEMINLSTQAIINQVSSLINSTKT